MFKNGQTILHRSFALALAAAIAVTAAGCSGAKTASAPTDATQAATEAAATPAESTAAAATAETAATSAAAAADTADTAAAAETADKADTAATSAAAETAATSAAAAETAAADETGSTAAAAESTAAETMENGVPKRDTADTALKESVLSEALVECTGWGQSAGSSLRAASAAVRLLQWANEADAANADSELLADTVKKEVKRLSDSQQETLKANWSSISFDAGMILDSFDEISPVLEDSGCADAAKEISSDKNSAANWEAVEHALDAALK